jgi:hypothetical protein
MSNSTQSIRKRCAFLVGINSYTDGQYPDLKFCVNDVKTLGDFLSHVGYSVIILHDEKSGSYAPTKNNISAELKTFCKAHPDDLLLVYFACHGIRIKDQPRLIAQDTRAALLEEQSIALAEIETMLRESDATRKILMLDACHTGIEMGRDIADPEFIHNVYEQAEGFALLAASTAQQKAFELGNVKHGVFSYFVLEGLSGAADRQSKQFVTVDDLRTHVLHGIRDWSKSEGGLVQEPTDKREGIGDFILVDYRNQSHPNLALEFVQPGAGSQRIESRASGSSPDAPLSLTQQLERESLEQELAARKLDFEGVDKLYLREMDPARKNSLKAQRTDLLADIQRIEDEFKALGRDSNKDVEPDEKIDKNIQKLIEDSSISTLISTDLLNEFKEILENIDSFAPVIKALQSSGLGDVSIWDTTITNPDFPGTKRKEQVFQTLVLFLREHPYSQNEPSILQLGRYLRDEGISKSHTLHTKISSWISKAEKKLGYFPVELDEKVPQSEMFTGELIVEVNPENEVELLLCGDNFLDYKKGKDITNIDEEQDKYEQIKQIILEGIKYSVGKVEQERQKRRFRNYDLIIEIFLPNNYLLENVDLWDSIDDLKEPIGIDYKIVLRSRKRIKSPSYRKILLDCWEALKPHLKTFPSLQNESIGVHGQKEFLEKQELQNQKSIEHFEPLDHLDAGWSEKFWKAWYLNLRNQVESGKKIGLKINCCLTEFDLVSVDHLFEAIFKSGIPIAIWLRANEDIDIAKEINELIAANPIHNFADFLKILKDKRSDNYRNSLGKMLKGNQSQFLGYPLSILYDDPYRSLPSDRFQLDPSDPLVMSST